MGLLTDHLRPGKIFFRNKEYDPQTVLAGIDSVSRYLSENLVSKSPFVYLFATNHIKTVFSYFGIIKARRICVIMDPKIGPLELKEKLLDTPPAACIRIDIVTESFDFSKEIELRNPPWKDDGDDDLSDVCTMIYTAAEDGYAKAAMLTHENMLANARAVAEGNKVNENSITCAILPIDHSFGLQVGVITPLIAGGLTIIEEDPDLIKLGHFVEKYLTFGITHFYSIPVVYYMLSKNENIKKMLVSAYSVISGGYGLSDDIRRRMIDKQGINLLEGYGLTEASPVVTWNFPGDSHHLKSVGRAIACCTIKVFDDSDTEIPYGKEGEICVKGANVMKGYFHHVQATKSVLKNGWLHTGDSGFIDEKGLVCLTGLKKKMINYAGKKVYPAEVERLFLLNSNVEKITIFDRYHLLSGQIVGATIWLKNNSTHVQNSLAKWGKDNISQYKIPEILEFR